MFPSKGGEVGTGVFGRSSCPHGPSMLIPTFPDSDKTEKIMNANRNTREVGE